MQVIGRMFLLHQYEEWMFRSIEMVHRNQILKSFLPSESFYCLISNSKSHIILIDYARKTGALVRHNLAFGQITSTAYAWRQSIETPHRRV